MTIFNIFERIKHNWKFEISHLVQNTLPYSEKYENKIKKIKNKHRGEVGYLIANGPSLNNINLNRLKKYPTIGMNRIYLKNFKPTYYVVEDHMLAEDNAEEISNLKGSEMFIPRDLSYCIKNNSGNIIYTNMHRRYDNFPQFGRNFSKDCYWGGTVTYYGMQLAYYLGFKKLYIVGLDHSYEVPKKEKGEKIVAKIADPNHFDPRYFGPGKRYHRPDMSNMEDSYKKAKKVYELSGRKIINATPASKLKVFRKTTLKEITKKTRK